MTEHTPGPWHFDGVCQIVEVERPHMRVAFLPSDHAKYASSEANGYLIAAAPDLLAALKSALLVMEAGHKIRNPEWDGTVTSTSAIGEARAAIAKAAPALISAL